jgi:integrase
MKTRVKLCKAPPRQTVRRRDGTKLSLHIKRNGRGMAEPYKVIEGEPYWKATYRHPDGRCKTFGVLDWRDAERKADKIREAFDHPPQAKPLETSKQMTGLVELFVKHVTGPDATCSARTARGYKKQVEQKIIPYFVGKLNNPAVSDVMPEHVDEWMAAYLPVSELKDETRRKLVELLDRLFKLAMDYRWCDWSPVLPKHHVQPAKLGQRKGNREGDQRVGMYVEPETIDAIVAKVAELRPRDPAAPIVVLLAARSGFRREELVHLRRENVELTASHAVIHVRPAPCGCARCVPDRLGTWRPKTGAGTRPAVVPPEVVPVLRAYLDERDRQHGGKAGWLLPAWPAGRERNHIEPGGQRLPDWGPDDFKEATEAVKLYGLVFHDTRHTAKTDLLARSGHQAAVDVVIGHRQVGLNDTYAHLEADLPRLYRLVFPDWAASEPVVKLDKKTA